MACNLICTTGYYCTSNSSSSMPSSPEGGQCQTGFYCPEGSYQPSPCDPGSYCQTLGLSTPTGNCTAGQWISNRTEISCNGLFCILSKSKWKLLVCMFVLQVTTAYSKLTLLRPLTTPQVTSALWATTVPWAALCTSLARWATTWMWQDRMSWRTVRTVQVVCTVQEVG